MSHVLINITIQPSLKLPITRERKAAVSKIRNIETISLVCILYILLNLIRLLLFLCDKFFWFLKYFVSFCQFAFFSFSLFVCLIIQKQLKIVVAFYFKKETKDVYENSIDLCWISLLFYFYLFFFVKCPKDFHYILYFADVKLLFFCCH